MFAVPGHPPRIFRGVRRILARVDAEATETRIGSLSRKQPGSSQRVDRFAMRAGALADCRTFAIAPSGS